MSSAERTIDEIYLEAMNKPAGKPREAFLQQACGGNEELRVRVDRLLHAMPATMSLPGTSVPASDVSATADYPRMEQEGAQIGPYKLLQEIGQGGMGAVFMAEQTQPISRRVALKIIKPGMDTRQVIARFEAERQALSLMNHPNIARVLDAGTTLSGRPYFVMELVNGVPITQYCDEQHLTTRERLELFIPVCEAVQHAHQKGIIHRDIKPSNVLVALYDGRPVPKVIDFGVAKATTQPLTERTLFTQLGQIVGTLEYMSPEQAQRNQLDVDTRSDVYSLGVLLYELVTGETPFDRRRLRSAAWDEMLRIIAEEEPPKPSLRLSSSESLPSIAANRRVEPKKLSTLVRGELDWIVMKALEKDRSRRYESANSFAADVNRYLHDEPVQACPPSLVYRTRKFIRRHKPLVAVTSLIALTVILGIAGLIASNSMIARERDAKVAALDEKEAALREKTDALAVATKAEQEQTRLRSLEREQRELAESRRQQAEKLRERAEANYQTAREAVDRLLTRVADDMQGKPNMDQIRRKLLEDALAFYQGFLSERSENSELKLETTLAHQRVADIFGLLGDWNKSLDNARTADLLLQELLSSSPGNLNYRVEQARGRCTFVEALLRQRKLVEAKSLLMDGIAKWEQLNQEMSRPPEYLSELLKLKTLARDSFYVQYDNWAEFQALMNATAELTKEIKTNYPDYKLAEQRRGQITHYSVYDLPKDRKKLQDLEQFFRGHLPAVEEAAAAHPDAPSYQTALSSLLSALSEVLLAEDKFAEMEPLHLKNIAICETIARSFPDDLQFSMGLGKSHYSYAMLLHHLNRQSEARDHFKKAISLISTGAAKEPNIKRHTSVLIGTLIFCPYPDLQDSDRAITLADSYGDMGDKIIARLNAGRFREALEHCQSALKDYPKAKAAIEFYPDILVPIIKMLEAYCRSQLGDKDDAKTQFLQAKSEFDQSPVNHYWFGFPYRFKLRTIQEQMGLISVPNSE